MSALRSNVTGYLRDLWVFITFSDGRQSRETVATLALANRRLRHETETLSEMLVRTESDRRAMRDSITERMGREQSLHHEISSLRRHLNIAIEQRDQARAARKKKL